MAFDELKAEISLLLTQMDNQPEDRHEMWLLLVEKMSEMRAYGMPVPDDFKRMEAELAKEFARESSGS